MANRDVKNSSRSSTSGRGRPGRKSGGGGLVAGIVIGLIVGVVVAVGLAMYLNRSATPFSNLEKLDRKAGSTASAPSTELLEPGTKIADVQANQPAPVASAPVKLEQPVPPPMPAEQPAATSTAPVASTKSKPATAAPATTGKDEQRFDFYKILPGQVDAVPADGKAASKDREPSAAAAAKKVFLQLGSFQNENEADNLKAKLALLGVEAKIQSVTIPDKGMVHRVRIGPLSKPEDIDRLRAQLKQDGINAAVVKAE
ncbi:SPOR domain-containing protein [Aquitalea sp. LB_tupeE]|uniref:SPOR domain-containing protein n=1 Tax=Aquitalea sp. LB_tupeE TaxID=2748078 RepID=UPI0015B86D7A|nr:SPOR domain-containing protein [Aquitalea sp. LB_tupeE]NWK77166.1 SPOR domain-containing protein [Aquitalea sp. LB_tupeE]